MFAVLSSTPHTTPTTIRCLFNTINRFRPVYFKNECVKIFNLIQRPNRKRPVSGIMRPDSQVSSSSPWAHCGETQALGFAQSWALKNSKVTTNIFIVVNSRYSIAVLLRRGLFLILSFAVEVGSRKFVERDSANVSRINIILFRVLERLLVSI